MKVSELWLREWVNPPLSGRQICDQLTMAGLEVDARYPVAGTFNQVVVGRVTKTSAHPDADRLTLCEVSIGASTALNIVCGASNVRPNLTVAVALPGAKLPGGLVIKESKLRGQVSQGMLCSATELGLEDSSDGIWELPDDAPIGVDLREYLALEDEIFELDLTPNRADCFSILGIAREVAVLNRLPLRAVEALSVECTVPDTLAVTIKDSVACPHYCGRVIRGIDAHAVTPIWLKERLRRCGIRAVHPVVDVTNYVMLELGQPLHAFDLQHIDGHIQVRWSVPQENIVLLNEQTVSLSQQTLLIADEHKALGLAGVMGSAGSAVRQDTVDIFLESAYFNPIHLSGVARRYGLSSDAAVRFERGVDPALQRVAIERATALILSISGGKAGAVTEVENEAVPSHSITFDPDKVKRLAGVTLAVSDMQLMLQGLGFGVQVHDSKRWTVTVPSYRFDIKLDVDLVEEIIRLYGYHNIEAIPYMAVVQRGQLNHEEQLLANIATFLCDNGYHETISYSFVDPELQNVLYPDKHVMSLLNPISSELADMRVGLWPGLLASMLYNVHRQQNMIKLFETGVVFEKNGQDLRERVAVAGLLMGSVGALSWNEPTRKYDFYDMSGDLHALIRTHFKSTVRLIKDAHDALHPGKTAKIVLNDGTNIGFAGVLHPKIADALEISDEVILFEIYVDALPVSAKTLYKQVSKYPQIRRDLSLLVDQSITAYQIEQVVRSAVAQKLLKNFDVFDVYTGDSIPDDKKSIAIALTLQDDNRTLMDGEINASIDAIIAKLDKELSIKIRE